MKMSLFISLPLWEAYGVFKPSWNDSRIYWVFSCCPLKLGAFCLFVSRCVSVPEDKSDSKLTHLWADRHRDESTCLCEEEPTCWIWCCDTGDAVVPACVSLHWKGAETVKMKKMSTSASEELPFLLHFHPNVQLIEELDAMTFGFCNFYIC